MRVHVRSAFLPTALMAVLGAAALAQHGCDQTTLQVANSVTVSADGSTLPGQPTTAPASPAGAPGSPASAPAAAPVAPGKELDAAAVARFADLTLACLHQEYPNKIAHVLSRDADARPPRELTPVFFGCYDWHSSVHGHWLLVRLCRVYPDAPFVSRARAALAQSFTPDKVAAEVAYLRGAGRATFERPYGLAWFLQLSAELHEWDDPQARQWAATLEPLEQVVVERLKTWLPKLSHPVRTGEHTQTAFALGLALDWARFRGDRPTAELIAQRARDYFAKDRGANLAFEPDGQAFLSPILAEADLMRRVLGPAEFAAWLGAFLPGLPLTCQVKGRPLEQDTGEIPTYVGMPHDSTEWLSPAVVTDRADGQLVHLDGLNLSRAWMLEGIAAGLPPGDPRIAGLTAAAQRHRAAGLAAISDQHYEGGHWLGSFAVYLVTQRGR